MSFGTEKSTQLPAPPAPKTDAPPQTNEGPIVAAPHTMSEYAAKFAASKVKQNDLPVLKSICARLLSNEPRYKQVEAETGVRWEIVAAVHERESSCNFDTYLQNGDPLFNRAGKELSTVHVPKGIGPFNPQNWVNAAIHALGGVGAHTSAPREIGYWLMWAENFNGSGYRKMGCPSPYIWSFTNQYVSGKYIYDGIYSRTSVDSQPGVASMLKVLGVVS